MNIEKAIEALRMENDLMQFDPNTGEENPIELQNKMNQECYSAHLVAISALEKQIPKKPTENFYDEQDGEDWYDEAYTYYSCPSCEDDREIGRYSKESEQWIFEIYEYCPYCGQKIDTSSRT